MKEITMPKLSDTMTEGAVVVWRKAVGSQVERGEVIAEVETDKATMELEAFASGVLLEIRVPAGTTVPVGTVIGLIGAATEQPAVPVAPPSAPLPTPAPSSAVESVVQPPPPPPVAVAPVPPETADEVLSAPVVRRRARELGIDLATVTGSGPGGRILLEDLETGAAMRTGRPVQAPSRETEPRPPVTASGGEPLSKMRLAIARTVSESWRTIPHFTVTVEVRMDAAEQFRQEQLTQQVEMSLTALLVKAAALALRKFPRLNASLQGERLVMHPEINIGIAVSRDDGLLVPILRECASLPLAEMATRLAQLVARARNGQLSQTELNGGTFAISNLGMYQVHSFNALILPPMAAVLAVGAVHDGVVVEQRQPVVARLLSLTLSADHRIVDGVYAAEFLQQVKRILEQPETLVG